MTTKNNKRCTKNKKLIAVIALANASNNARTKAKANASDAAKAALYAFYR